MEKITSLRIAIKREKAIKLIQENNFQHKKENNLKFGRKRENNFIKKEENFFKLKKKMERERRKQI